MRVIIIIAILAFSFNAQAQRYFVSEKENSTQYWVLDSLSASNFNLGKEIAESTYKSMQVSEETKINEQISVIDTPIAKEINLLKSIAPNATFIFKRYNLSNSNKNGFSLREIATELKIDHLNKRKKDLSYEIYNTF